MITRILGLILSIILLLFSGCNADRINPLDPDNPGNVLVKIEGTVETISVPRSRLNDVEVFWQTGNKLVKTNTLGLFSIEEISQNNGWLYFRKSGYSPDSIFVDWQNRKNISIQMFLNAVPKLDTLVFGSSVLNKYPNRQTYSIEVRAGISDDENDVDSVFIFNEDLNILKNLEFNISTGFFENSFSVEQLEIQSIDETVGKTFIIRVNDKNGKHFDIGSSNIKRIIKEEIEFDSPADNQLVTVPFNFRWRRFTPGFDFNYMIQIYTDEVSPELIWDSSQISKDSISVSFSNALAAGEYFWVIWCYDEFNNSGRSKPATFRIE